MAYVLVSGGTGYLGRQLIRRRLERRHPVKALARPGAEGKFPPGGHPVVGDALDGSTLVAAAAPPSMRQTVQSAS